MRILVYILCCYSIGTYAQIYEQGKNYRLGIKTGINFSTYLGDELQNPRPRFGYTTGAYFRRQLRGQSNLHIEFLANYKGSNFNNGINEYVKISAFHLDLPVLYAYALKENKYNILIGPQFSHSLLSSLYINGKRKSHFNDLNLSPLSLDACLAFQINGKIGTWQTALKMGLTNMNNGINFENVDPPTGNNGMIRSLCLETAFLF